MRYLWPLAVVAALTGCASADPVIKSSPTPVAVNTEPSTPRPTPEPSPTPTAEPTPDGPPKQCRDYKSSGSMTDKTATKAAAKAALPPTVVLMHVQTIHSVDEDEPGMNEAVARVCSYPMTEDELIEIATAIAVAMKPSKVSDDLAVLVVSAWHPDGDSIAQGEAVQSDYQLFTWEPGSPMASNWE